MAPAQDALTLQDALVYWVRRWDCPIEVHVIGEVSRSKIDGSLTCCVHVYETNPITLVVQVGSRCFENSCWHDWAVSAVIWPSQRQENASLANAMDTTIFSPQNLH